MFCILENDIPLPPSEETKIIYGIVGIIRLIAGKEKAVQHHQSIILYGHM